MRRAILAFTHVAATVGLLATPASAAPRHRMVRYHDANAELLGYLAYDDASSTKQPGVLVVQDWAGVGPFIERRADALAARGYVVFAPDIYGAGIRPQGMKAQATEMHKYTGNLPLLRRRMQVGLAQLMALPGVDANHVAVVGYSFGGLGALELARAGAPVAAVVMYYAVPSNDALSGLDAIKGQMLLLKGGSDPLVSEAASTALQTALTSAKVSWESITFSGAYHDFANDTIQPEPGFAAYDASTDRRAWQETLSFLAQALKDPN